MEISAQISSWDPTQGVWRVLGINPSDRLQVSSCLTLLAPPSPLVKLLKCRSCQALDQCCTSQVDVEARPQTLVQLMPSEVFLLLVSN